MLGTDIDFLSDPAWFRPLIVLQEIWKNTGWGTIIFLAALATVDQDQYEAADHRRRRPVPPGLAHHAARRSAPPSS